VFEGRAVEGAIAVNEGVVVISILDYGAGNLRSVQNTLGEIGAEYELVRDSAALSHATKIILPGVGHFGQMMRALDQMQVRDALLERIRAGIPFLGICLGLQALFESSEEAPEERGLGLFQGRIRRFSANARVPHMGWNEVEPRNGTKLLRNLAPHPYLYFAHSYYAPLNDATAATCNYTVPYTAVLETKNIFGVQFHPEKSGPIGLKIVRNFVEL
jgi:glutamine amidotransferase